MKPFKIVQTNRQIGDPDHYIEAGGLWDHTVDTEDNPMDALLLARQYAIEHAARIDVDVSFLELGAEFTTNNGTLVRYSVVAR